MIVLAGFIVDTFFLSLFFAYAGLFVVNSMASWKTKVVLFVDASLPGEKNSLG